MWRFYRQNIVTALIFNIIIAAAIAIIMGIFSLFVSLVETGAVPTIYNSFNFCAIATFFAVVLVSLFIYPIRFGGSREKDSMDSYFSSNDITGTKSDDFYKKYEPNKLYFIKRIREKKYLKSIYARLTFVPCVCIGALLLVGAIFYRNLTNGDSAGKVILACVLASSATCWIVFGTVGFFSLNRRYEYCVKCHSMYSFIQDSFTDYKRWKEKETKSEEHYGTVGTVYVKKQKVGEIKGHTHTTYESRDVEKESATVGRHCACCGHKDNVGWSSTRYGKWK